MKRLFSFCLLFVLGMTGLNAQKINDDSILLIVGSDTTTRGEFYKNYTQNAVQGRKISTKAELENYLQLYINFRLKVEAAKDAGYDTIKLLQDELQNYRAQFAKPYLSDQELAEDLYEEAYHHMRYNMGARHILIAVNRYDKPADTLAAYKKCLEIRNQLMDGADFCDMVIRYSSEYRRPKGPFVPQKTGYEGRLPYITGMSMVYPFEQALYGLKSGEISMPVRTRYGYHLIQLLDKRPALGKVTFLHIMAMNRPGDTTQKALNRMKMVYDSLQAGGNFYDLASRYSDDRSSASRGGEVTLTKLDRMYPEVIEQLFSLKEGEYTRPFPSRLGWHIVKLVSKAGIEDYSSARAAIMYTFDNDPERGMMPVEAQQKDLLKDAKWKLNQNVWKEVLKWLPDTVYGDKLPKDSMDNPVLFGKTLLVYEGKDVPVWSFIKLARLNSRRDVIVDVKMWADDMFKTFLGTRATIHEMSVLEQKYPDFAAMMKEYRDGIYLFDINNHRVWGKAVDDTVGQQAYYDEHKSKYFSPAKAIATVFTYNVAKIDTKKVRALMQKAYKGHWTFERLKAEAVDMFGESNIRVDSMAYLKGKNYFVDKVEWKPGLSGDLISGTDSKAFVWIHDVIEPRQYSLEEVKGTVITDYQGYLEDEWIKELKNTYKVTLNKDVFESLLPR
ncbi:MAG: peptidylprolyl isomerase [Bacteroides sp.]|nr:peptidylprolyl isomerase [Ruminococcus flavefaciens]MCM1554321.1 peptidylprolyl isomerase [Bacteroides sp.]